MRLMIVDDHSGVRGLIRQMLAAQGDTLCECGSGDEAVQMASTFKPDWVTMDLRMPGLNGFEALRSIRKLHPAARVLIVTSYDQPALRQAAVDSGAAGFFLKGDLAALQAALGRATEPATPTSWPVAVGKRPGGTEAGGEVASEASGKWDLITRSMSEDLSTLTASLLSSTAGLRRDRSSLLSELGSMHLGALDRGCEELRRRLEEWMQILKLEVSSRTLEVRPALEVLEEAWKSVRGAAHRAMLHHSMPPWLQLEAPAGVAVFIFEKIFLLTSLWKSISESSEVLVRGWEAGNKILFAVEPHEGTSLGESLRGASTPLITPDRAIPGVGPLAFLLSQIGGELRVERYGEMLRRFEIALPLTGKLGEAR